MNNFIKKTEIGFTPLDWEIEKDFLKIKSGFGFKLKEYTESGVPLIRIDNVGYGKITDENLCYLPKSYLEKYKNFTLKKGDILLALNRPITNNQLKIGKVNTEPAILYQRVGCIKSINNSFLLDFYYFYLQSPIFIKKLSSILVGSDQPYIKSSEFSKIYFPKPPIKEQKKIASILSTLDDLIENIDHLINSYTLLKKGLIQTLLTKGIGHKEFKKTPLGELPLVWKIVELLDYVDVIKGISYKSSEYCNEDEGVNLINLKCVAKSGGFSKSGLKYFKGDFTKEDVIKDTDIIIANTDLTRAGDIIGCPIIIPDEYFKENTLITMDLSVLRIKDNSYNYNFLYYFLMSSCCKKYLKSYSRGSTVLHLDLKGLKKMKLPLPPIEEQNKISSILLLVDNLVDLYLIRRDGASILKKGLMQQLLTGKIRVKV